MAAVRFGLDRCGIANSDIDATFGLTVPTLASRCFGNKAYPLTERMIACVKAVQAMSTLSDKVHQNFDSLIPRPLY
jgi:hypothetical protein